MKQSEYEDFKNLWRSACETTLGKIPTETGLSLAFGALSPYSFAEIRRALVVCLRSSGFKPTPAAVIEHLTGGSAEDRAAEAFGIVKKALSRINSGESVRFDDPCIHYALECGCGGWTGFARMNEVESERIFTKYYAAGARLGKSWGDSDVPDHMPGKRENEDSILCPWTKDQIVDVQTREPAPTLPRLN